MIILKTVYCLLIHYFCTKNFELPQILRDAIQEKYQAEKVELWGHKNRTVKIAYYELDSYDTPILCYHKFIIYIQRIALFYPIEGTNKYKIITHELIPDFLLPYIIYSPAVTSFFFNLDEVTCEIEDFDDDDYPNWIKYLINDGKQESFSILQDRIQFTKSQNKYLIDLKTKERNENRQRQAQENTLDTDNLYKQSRDLPNLSSNFQEKLGKLLAKEQSTNTKASQSQIDDFDMCNTDEIITVNTDELEPHIAMLLLKTEPYYFSQKPKDPQIQELLGFIPEDESGENQDHQISDDSLTEIEKPRAEIEKPRAEIEKPKNILWILSPFSCGHKTTKPKAIRQVKHQVKKLDKKLSQQKDPWIDVFNPAFYIKIINRDQ